MIEILSKKLTKKQVRERVCKNCNKQAEHYITGCNGLDFACSEICIQIIIQKQINESFEKLK